MVAFQSGTSGFQATRATEAESQVTCQGLGAGHFLPGLHSTSCPGSLTAVTGPGWPDDHKLARPSHPSGGRARTPNHELIPQMTTALGLSEAEAQASHGGGQGPRTLTCPAVGSGRPAEAAGPAAAPHTQPSAEVRASTRDPGGGLRTPGGTLPRCTAGTDRLLGRLCQGNRDPQSTRRHVHTASSPPSAAGGRTARHASPGRATAGPPRPPPSRCRRRSGVPGRRPPARARPPLPSRQGADATAGPRDGSQSALG